MPFANSTYTDMITTTIENRSGELADNVTNNNALLRRLKKRGNVRTFSGGNLILEEIMYGDSTTVNVDSYSGYETINITPNSPISAAQFSIRQYAGSISISGLETLQNASKEQIIDLLEGRHKVTEAQLQNRISQDIYTDGTGNSSKNITGLAAAVPDDPTTGTYGGINRATAAFAFWRPQYYRGVTDGGAAVSSANIGQYMTTLALRCVRGTDMPDLYVGDATYFALYVNSLQSIQRVTSEQEAGAGFATLKFYGGGTSADVVMDGGVYNVTTGATAAHMWLLNTNYIHFRPHAERNFVPIGGERQSVNQDAIVKLIGWAGNMTTSCSFVHGVLIA